MGAGVSNWQLARAVSMRGQLGVVSGTVIDLILTRRLQLGDPGGHMRRALSALPDPNVARRILDQYFIPGGKAPDQPFAGKPMVGLKPGRHLEELLVAANFVEVYLAKEGHDGVVGINYLNKIQTPLLPSLYGAILAGVDYIIVGAGIPVAIPGILDNLCRLESASLELTVRGAEGEQKHTMTFDPKRFFDGPVPSLRRPGFFPILSSVTLANMLIKKCSGKVDGLIIEGPSAGGHNAPPRGHPKLSSEGEPVYGVRDEIDLTAIQSLELPFWLAGSYGSPRKLQEATAAGASGVQVGLLFAFCEESGLREDLKRDIIQRALQGQLRVFTDPIASPAGFPFKVLVLKGTLSESNIYQKRYRHCDLGYLREAIELPDGTLVWRCPAEDPESYVRKGGRREDTVGRKCLCNGLMANIGMAQVREDHKDELPLLTSGEDFSSIQQLVRPGEYTYSASDVIDFLLSPYPIQAGKE